MYPNLENTQIRRFDSLDDEFQMMRLYWVGNGTHTLVGLALINDLRLVNATFLRTFFNPTDKSVGMQGKGIRCLF